MADNLSTEWPTDDELKQSNSTVLQALDQANTKGTAKPTAATPGADISIADVTSSMDKSLEALKKAQDLNKQAADQERANATEAKKLAGDVLNTPHAGTLKLEDYPELPPDRQQPPQNAFGSVLGAMAMLAGAFSRRPMIDTMGAMAGILKGANQGNQQEREYDMKRYQAGFNRIKEENAKRTDEYNAILNDEKLTIDQKNAYLTAVIAANKDTVAAKELEEKGYEGVSALEEKRAELYERFLDASNRLKATQGMFGALSPGGDKLVDAQAAQLLRGVPPNLAVPGYGNAGVEARKEAQQRAVEMYMQQNPGSTAVDAGLFMADQMINYRGVGAMANTISRQVGQVRYSANELTNVLVPNLKAVAARLNFDHFPDVNSALLFAERHGGGADAQNWRNLIIEAQQSYARILSRGGEVTDGQRAIAAAAIPENMSTEQISSTLDLVQTITAGSLQQALLALSQVSGAEVPGGAGAPPNQPTTSTNKQFTPGKVYKDAKGNSAIYNADGTWTPQ